MENGKERRNRIWRVDQNKKSDSWWSDKSFGYPSFLNCIIPSNVRSSVVRHRIENGTECGERERESGKVEKRRLCERNDKEEEDECPLEVVLKSNKWYFEGEREDQESKSRRWKKGNFPLKSDIFCPLTAFWPRKKRKNIVPSPVLTPEEERLSLCLRRKMKISHKMRREKTCPGID